ncbi:hypothetical protein [Paenibacillus sp. N3.4]|uniref:hypothetical protein n=1 Tax=Paenibacillus sp. N3.4 TaxID=2603222 RepID=UPI0021C47443|nr:hypothetical protein [Paenibacillus sp. N3.4]
MIVSNLEVIPAQQTLLSSRIQRYFRRCKPTDDPTVYVGVSSKSDPGQAPEGKENLFVLTLVPPLLPAESWESQKTAYRSLAYRDALLLEAACKAVSGLTAAFFCCFSLSHHL